MFPVAQAKIAALMLACGAGSTQAPPTAWMVLKQPFSYLHTAVSKPMLAPPARWMKEGPPTNAETPPPPPAPTTTKPAAAVTKQVSKTSPIVTAAPAFAQRTFFNVMSNETEVAQVLQAISARTGASIVYAGKPGTTVSINVRVDSAESAIRSVAAAAGLIYRRVGNMFVVAPPANMRQALEPYGGRATLKLSQAVVAKAAPVLQESIPYLTVRSLGDRLVLIGIEEDIQEAREYVEHLTEQDVKGQTVDEAVTITKASTAELIKVVASLYPEVRAVTTSTTAIGGAIALSGPPASVERAKQLLTRLDVGTSPSDAPDFVTRVVELKYTSARALSEFLKKAAPDVESISGPETPGPARPRFAPLSASLGGASATGQGTSNMGATGGQGQQNEEETQAPANQAGMEGIGRRSDRSRTVVLRGSQAAVDRAMTLVQRIDVKPRQVMVEVRVVETSKSFSENLGLEYSFAPFRFTEVRPGTTIPSFPTTGNSTQGTRDSGVGRFSRVPWDVLANLNAQVREGKAKVLASPSVQVLDNEDANIFIGDTIRARIAQATGFGAQTVDIREFPIGIVLLLRSRIGADGNITMHVNPVVSSITGLGPDNIPQTSTREAQTTVMIQDGETIAIGGLIRDEMTRVVSRVPILSQIPIIGELFKNRSTNKIRSDIIVTITPHIIRDEPERGGQTP